MKNTLDVATYFEEGAHFEGKHFLKNYDYEKAIRALIIVCTDVMIINKANKEIFLPKRKSKPMADAPWFIGGRLLPGVSEQSGMKDKFQKETGLSIDAKRFTLLCMNRYQWKDRQQEPQNTACDALVYVFAVELSDEEIAAIKLNEDEYYSEEGLLSYNAETVMKLHPGVQRAYEICFPQA